MGRYRPLVLVRQVTGEAMVQAAQGIPAALSRLPRSVFVEFEAIELAEPSVVWRNGSMHSLHDVIDYAYCCPLPGELNSAYSSRKKRPLAERYGGFGVGNNGGGARTGLLGDMQAKGIGRTPLSGVGNDFFHNYGGASLADMLLEAIWGEVCSVALPYGAARTIAVFTTGTTVPKKYPKTGATTNTARAIALRDPVVRLGHFMRAAFFRDEAGYEAGALEDVIRTRDAVLALEANLSLLLGGRTDVASRDSEAALYAGLEEVLRRHAEQLGTARSKRVMHGSLTASNTALSGAWIDFAGGISTVSDYGRIILPRGAPDFLNEEKTIQQSLSDLLFYIGKYHPRASTIERHFSTLWGGFLRQLTGAFEQGILNLFGFPKDVIDQIPGTAREAALSCVREVMLHSPRAPFVILLSDNDAAQRMPPRMGPHQVNEAILAAALLARGSETQGQAAMKEAIVDPNLAERSLNAFGRLIRNADQLSSDSGRERAAFECFRKNLPVHRLYRTELHPMLEDAVDVAAQTRTTEVLTSFVNEVIEHGQFHLAEIADGASQCCPTRAQWQSVAGAARLIPINTVSPRLVSAVAEYAQAQ